MHCYLFDKLGMEYDKLPAWYVEGAPTWVMEQLGTSSSRLGGIWRRIEAVRRMTPVIRTFGIGFGRLSWRGPPGRRRQPTPDRPRGRSAPRHCARRNASAAWQRERQARGGLDAM